MTRRTYHIEHQRLIKGEGYVPCEPHQANRCVVIETTCVPPKAGRRGYHIKKTVGNYSGSAMALNAKLLCDRLTGRTKPKPRDAKTNSQIYARSCTIAEYDAIMQQRRETGSY